MAILKTLPYMYSNLNMKDLAQLKEKKNLVLVLPIGAMESHGPHCPLGTDTFNSTEIALRTAEKLRKKGYEAFVLPPLAYTPAQCARNFPGTINISIETQTALITEICIQLIRQGITNICLCNNHGDPANIKAIYNACESIFEKVGVRLIYPDKTRKKYAVRLPDSYQKAECHGDSYEVSMVMAIDHSLINEERRKALPPVHVNLVEKMFTEKLDDFKLMGMPDSYNGDPAAATAEEGEQTLDTIADIMVESVEERFQGKDQELRRGLFAR
ncbi:MAG: creatininase family protein [Deltaproteobacteria bacterium]|nr:creatininase family protein [Deltaproteobacteria bacterium]MBW2044349.1 creatininase family protein [Deltaproteobacteria bacterium]MBW2301266.1 creatininase family protein [Deltaproteobacteria bacterium]